MSLRSFLVVLRNKWETSLDHAFRDRAVEQTRRERARDEFINTLIINHATDDREFDGRAFGNRMRD